MTNINAYYPQRLKGWALGINAGGGNLGVPVVQLVGLLILATVGAGYPRLLVVIYIPLIILAAIGSARNMNNLSQMTNSKRAMRDVTKDGNTWVISLLYIGTFGSFIGFSFAFGQVLQVQFADIFSTPVKAAYLTFIGPLIGSLIRPVGGSLADKFGGSRVSFVNFVAMALGAGIVLTASLLQSLPLYLVGFVMLFAFSGLGNGSVYKMIPAIFKAKSGTEIINGADPTMSMAQVAAACRRADRHRRCDRRLRRRAGEPGVPAVVPGHQVRRLGVHRVHLLLRGLLCGHLVRLHPPVPAQARGRLSGHAATSRDLPAAPVAGRPPRGGRRRRTGGGPEGRRRRWPSHADVLVVAPYACEQIARGGRRRTAELASSATTAAGDLDGAWLAVAATGDRCTDEAVERARHGPAHLLRPRRRRGGRHGPQPGGGPPGRRW